MKHPHRLAPFAFVVVSNCGGHATPPPADLHAVVTDTTPPPPASAPIDRSEMAAPPELLATLRFAPPGSLVERVARITGLGSMVQTGFDELVLDILDQDRSLVEIVDRTQPWDAAVLIDERGSPQLVISFPTGSVAQVESRLASTHRLGTAVNQLRPVEPRRTRRDEPGNTSLPQGRSVCVLAPTAQESASRLVCAQHRGEALAVGGYLGRTMARDTTVVPDSAVLSLATQPVRARYARQFHEALSNPGALLDGMEAGRRGRDREPMSAGARALLLPIVTSLAHELDTVVDDVSGATVALTLTDERLTLRLDAALAAPRGEFVQAMARSLLDAPAVAPELLAHLPPHGAGYVTAAGDARALAPFVTFARDVTNAILSGGTGLTPADTAELQRLLASFTTPDRGEMAYGFGADEAGHAFGAGTIRAETPATRDERIASYRAWFAFVRRPAVARQIAHLYDQFEMHGIDTRTWREMPTRGLPAGSLMMALSFPQPAPAATTAANPSAHATANPRAHTPGSPARTAGTPHAPFRIEHTQYVIVPTGERDLQFVSAPDARAVYNATFGASSHATPGFDVQRIAGGNGAAVTYAIVPSGFPDVLRPTLGEEAMHGLTQGLSALPDHGDTPVIVRTGATRTADGTHFTIDVVLDRTTLAALPALMMLAR